MFVLLHVMCVLVETVFFLFVLCWRWFSVPSFSCELLRCVCYVCVSVVQFLNLSKVL